MQPPSSLKKTHSDVKSNKRLLQRRIAYEAARILTELRSDDQLFAMQKAAAKLGISDRRLLPNRAEIEQALREQQRLFRGEEQHLTLSRLRRTALQVMSRLSHYHPRLTGPVSEGTADSNSRIRLYLFADAAEEILMTLRDSHISWQESDLILRFPDTGRRTIPCFRIQPGDAPVELAVLPASPPYSMPLDPRDNQPVKGITTRQLEQLVETEEEWDENAKAMDYYPG
jgi:hypothetical protein